MFLFLFFFHLKKSPTAIPVLLYRGQQEMLEQADL